MATLENTQIRVLVDSVRDTDSEREESHNERHIRGERTPLLRTTQRRKLKLRGCCVKSKAAMFVLIWNALVTVMIGYAIQFGLVLATATEYELQTFAPAYFGFLALLYLFYPLAGCLADIRCGRYKAITNSLWFMIWGGLFTCIGSIIIVCYSNGILSFQTVSVTTILGISFGLSFSLGTILLISSYISFSANVIQFGMDQLHDSPSEDSVLFIHSFVFASNLGAAIDKLVIVSMKVVDKGIHPHQTQYIPEFIAGVHTTPIVALILLCISACIARRKRHWFLIDSGSRNPYKLVYKVIKFAAQHKSPICRSAFTYCEDELPSRMDLAKGKYGGPFTTEQVEDVKAFLGILQVLLTLGPMFATDIAVSSMLFKFITHLRRDHSKNGLLVIPLHSLEIGELTQVIPVILIPFYLCVLRPFIHRYIPGMLTRIELGMIIRVLSLLSAFIIDTIGHINSNNTTYDCFITHPYHHRGFLSISMWCVILIYVSNAISDMLFYIAAYEFICAQSPHAMKGLLIGTFFTVKGVFQLIGVLIILVLFATWKLEVSFPSCGFVYYLINILIIFVGLFAYSCVSRRYQYRQRDEPDNIYRYAEDYYDRAHD